MHRYRIAALVVLLFCFAAPVRAEDIPALANVYGQPPVGFAAPWYGGIAEMRLAVDDDHIYVSGPGEIGVFSRQGDWLTFWPFSSKARGVGDTAPLASWLGGRPEQVSDLATSAWETIYALSSAYAAVHCYDRDGTFLGGWGGHGDAPNQFAEDEFPVDICASAHAVYVLSQKEEGWDGGSSGGTIREFTPEGDLLRVWDTPTDATLGAIPYDIAPAADGGVWLLNWIGLLTSDASGPSELRLHHYGADGVELASWITPDSAFRVAAGSGSSQDQLWLLVSTATARRVEVCSATGQLALAQQIDASFLSDLAVSGAPEFAPVALAGEQLPGPEAGPLPSTLRLVTNVFDDLPDLSPGSYPDLLAHGALADPPGFAVTPSGDVYAKIDDLRSDLNYVTHLDPTGQLVEVLRTNDWPVWNPTTGSVDFLPWTVGRDSLGDNRGAPIVQDAQGHIYSVDVDRWEPLDGILRWVVTLVETIPGKVTAPYPVFDASTIGRGVLGTAGIALGADGNLRVVAAIDVRDPEGSDPGAGTLWVGTVSPGGQVLSSWTDADFGWHFVNALALDPAGNVYVAGDGVWKYSPDGKCIGRIGGWGGTGDPRDAPGSLVADAAAVDMDATGHLRVLDSLPSDGATSAVNHLLVFAYTPGAFADIPYWYWAKDAISAVAAAGLASGYPDGTYQPTAPVTRDQMAVYISRAVAGGEAGVPAGPAAPSFPDVPTTSWAYRYVAYAKQHGIIEGYADGYHPDEVVTRGQLAVYVARALAGSDAAVPAGPAGATFPDVPTDFWAYRYIAYCAAHGIVQGFPDGDYHPDALVTRDQMAVYLQRAYHLPSDPQG